MLGNEKYAGDLRLQKTVVPNFLTHRSKRNTGEADQYYVENSHEPIIPKAVFAMAQAEAARRSASHASEDGKTAGTKYGSRRALSGRCRFGCGSILQQKRSDAGRWVCPRCGFSIGEAGLQAAVMESFGKLGAERDKLTALLAQADALLAETEPEAPAALPKHAEAKAEERTRALFRRFRIMAALDWIENAGKASTAESCHSLEQFIGMTRPPALTVWNDDTILTFIEGVELVDGAVAVRFKAGIAVAVALP